MGTITEVDIQAQVHFAHMVDALEEGDIERADVCRRIFNEISDGALNHLSLEQLVQHNYVNEQDAFRIQSLHEFHAEGP